MAEASTLPMPTKASSRDRYRALRHLCVSGVVLSTFAAIEGLLPVPYQWKLWSEPALDIELGWLLPVAIIGLVISWFLRRRQITVWRWILAIASALQAGYWTWLALMGTLSMPLATVSVWTSVVLIQCFDATNQRVYHVLQGLSLCLLLVAGWQQVTEWYPHLLGIVLVLLVFSCLAAHASPVGVAHVYVDSRFPGLERALGVGVMLVATISVLAWPIYAYLPRPTNEQRSWLVEKIPFRGLGKIGATDESKSQNKRNFGQTSRLVLSNTFPPEYTGKTMFLVQGGSQTAWREKVLDRYNGRSWRLRTRQQTLSLIGGGDGAAFTPLFRLDGAWRKTSRMRTYKIHVLDQLGRTLLRPMGANGVNAPGHTLRRDESGNVYVTPSLKPPMTYYVFVPERRQAEPPLPSKNEGEYLRLPAMTARVENLVAELAAPHPDNDRKIANAFIRYIKENCAYKLQPHRIPFKREATDYFLFERRQGWCVHFASALAVMCRIAKIPARVITGYGPGVYDPLTRSTRVRDSDAHAWVEARLAGGAWQSLDSTPAASSPLTALQTPPAQTGAMSEVRSLVTATQKELGSWYRVIYNAIYGQPLWLLLPGLLTGGLIIAWRRYQTRARRLRIAEFWRDIDAGTPRVAARAAYLLVATHLARYGYGRVRKTTPEEYLRQLRREKHPATESLTRIIATYEMSAFGPRVRLHWDRARLKGNCEEVLQRVGLKGTKTRGDSTASHPPRQHYTTEDF